MGATSGFGSDCYPYTVVELRRKGRTIILQSDFAFRVDTNGAYTEAQTYVCIPNPKGQIIEATLRKDGYYRKKGSKYGTVFLGRRRKHIDPLF